MSTDLATANRAYPLPSGGNDLAHDVARLIAALEAVDVDVAAVLSTLVLKAPLLNAALAGAPTAPTPAGTDNSTRIATTQWARAYFADFVGAAPEALNTITELAAALHNDPDIVDEILTSIGLKAPLASPALTGTPTAPTAAPGTNTTQLATTSFVAALGGLKANLASPAFTGTPTAPTAADGTNTTQVATTGFVQQAIALFKAAANTFTARQAMVGGATGNNAMNVATGSLGEVEVRGNGTGAAMQAFHRAGAFAAYFGLDTDNKWKVGGWSMGAAAYEIVHMGNRATLLGTITGRNLTISTAAPSGGVDGDAWWKI
ncbi:hypothetical protein [Mesorhizobium sp.]|uniref:hypothetical protein n=1 Tax=Mesorhizobium sp. TaxID=1871066 RepID=UPI0011F72190|nr:hypothetical protein [Mesorhizobium sp.]TIW97780.1 MAG: hypothetical protein E5V45_14745 [Mesorhizobium sp.]